MMTSLRCVQHPAPVKTCRSSWTDQLCVPAGAKKIGHKVGEAPFFDTVRIEVGDAAAVVSRAAAEGVNLRQLDGSTVTISLDETTRLEDVDQLLRILAGGSDPGFTAESLASQVNPSLHRICSFTPKI